MTLKEKLTLFNPLYWPAWLVLGLLWLITRTSDRFQISVGKCIGRFLLLLGGKLKYITKKNIILCYPNLTAEEQKQLIKINFMSVGIGIIEAARACWLPENKLMPQFKLDGAEHAEQAFSRGKGIILVSPHFTCLELVGRLLSLKYDFAVMYRPHKKPILAFIQETFRKKFYKIAIPRHRIRELLRTLEKNMAVWYAYDVDGGKKRSVFAPFFGIQTASLTAVSRLAEMSGASIIPMYFYRDNNSFHYTIKLLPALEQFPSGDYQKDAAQLNAILETAIRQHPEQYVWQYKRFNTRPKDSPRLY